MLRRMWLKWTSEQASVGAAHPQATEASLAPYRAWNTRADWGCPRGQACE